MTDLFLGLGSNLGDRKAALQGALHLLAEQVGELCECSELVETEPWGYQSQNKYVNAVARFRTELTVGEVLEVTQAIERELGRTVKTAADGVYTDRVIDIDILLYGSSVIYSPALRVPHPRMWQRQFVMEPLSSLSHTPHLCRQGGGTAATIGFFDGVHLGHQHLMTQLCQLASGQGQLPLAVTFDRHPSTVVPHRQPTPILTTRSECRERLLSFGVEVAELQFDACMSQLTAREFMKLILHEQLNVKTLLVGYDHHFGRPLPERRETIDDYKAYGRECGMEVVVATELSSDFHVSSSAIRRALLAGDVATANSMLGRPYRWTGRVVHGHAIGRQLGFPTANLVALNPEQLLPARGVYAAMVDICDGVYPAMLNIGTRPTISPADHTVTVEAHLFDYEGDLYGQTVTVAFHACLRQERCFNSEEELMAQLHTDKTAALQALSTTN
ncbi:MAG: riboflavin biosynthesis protein RibF [Bacteroidaceae bacterium]|nr:riboflavin biosynthesis protein RibF [Bacteroidaceae bacterium]